MPQESTTQKAPYAQAAVTTARQELSAPHRIFHPLRNPPNIADAA